MSWSISTILNELELSMVKILKHFFQVNTELKGMAPENALPLFAFLTNIAKILMLIVVLFTILSIPSLIAQKPVGIYAGHKLPGQK